MGQLCSFPYLRLRSLTGYPSSTVWWIDFSVPESFVSIIVSDHAANDNLNIDSYIQMRIVRYLEEQSRFEGAGKQAISSGISETPIPSDLYLRTRRDLHFTMPYDERHRKRKGRKIPTADTSMCALIFVHVQSTYTLLCNLIVSEGDN